MYEAIIEQIREHCDCLADKDMENVGLIEKSISQLIQLLSTITCWTNGSDPCATFLNSERMELFDMEKVVECGQCDSGIMEVDLFYTPVEPDSIKVKVLKRNRLKFEEIELDESQYSFNHYEDKLYIDLSDYAGTNPCNCDVIQKVIVEYVAGYDLLPECLMPIFCDLLDEIIEMNRCDCPLTCEPCQIDESSLSSVEIVEDEQFSKSLYIRNTIMNAYSKQLAFISLCGKQKAFWGMVV